MRDLLDKYNIRSVEEFVPKFYYANLENGYQINKKAVNNLLKYYTKEQLIKIQNYDEIGIVEYVANDNYYIEDNLIKIYED